MSITRTIAQEIHSIVRADFHHEFGRAKTGLIDQPIWQAVRDTGTRLWLDTGDIDTACDLWCRQFQAVTTNNTLLNREVQKGIYDDLIGSVSAALRQFAYDMDEQQFLYELTFVLNARHALRLVEMLDANVSVELHTDFGNDVDMSVEYGRRYYAICPERFYVKVPLTPAGFIAARKLGKLGVPINFTLGFSARQNYFAALFANPRFVNVFLGRLNSFVADNGLGSGENMGEKTTLTTQRHLLKLRKESKTDSCLIGASMRGSSQVAALAGLDVHTIPTKVASDFLTNPPDKIRSRLADNPQINLAQGVTLQDFNGTTLWDVPESFANCVEKLLSKDIDNLVPDQIMEHFENAGFGDFLYDWSADDIETVRADGKIPVYEHWKDQLSSCKLGLDSLMNISAFYSFDTDQKQLDDRVKGLL